ncbi:Disease resistance-responsive (dirigent-like protein) family protein [Euphorbia peplus]|nr:Disease resistance-responsive (dirigent-like protein) family protein [Euphorbia peplus]
MATLLLISTFFSMLFITSTSKFSEQFPLSISINRMEKTTRLHFYFHDILTGKNPTAILIAGSKDKTFGKTFIIDDPLTEESELASKLVGRAQGMYSFASQNDFGLLMVVNFGFVEGMYNGSTLSILGKNPIMNTDSEMPVVGGTGLFRYARGYALARTVSADQKTGNAVVEYNVSVVHF